MVQSRVQSPAFTATLHIRDSMTVMQKKAYWVMPTGIKEVHYAPVKDIDFVGKKGSAAILESLDFRPSPLTTQLHASSQVSASSTVVSFASSGSTMASSANSLPSQLSSPTSVNAQILPSSRSGTVSVPVVPLLGLQSHQHQFVKKHQVMMRQWPSLVA